MKVFKCKFRTALGKIYLNLEVRIGYLYVYNVTMLRLERRE